MTQPPAEQPAVPSMPELPSPDQPAPYVGAPPAAGAYPEQAPAPQQYQNFPPAPQQYQAPQYQAPTAPQQYQNQAPQYQAPQYQAPTAPQQYQGQYPQMSQQPPMPNPAYGYPQPKSKIAAGLLGIFLGGLGIHRFYLGYTTIGVIQLVLTVVLGIFTLGLVAVWGLVEGIMILAGATYFQRDARGIPLRE